MSRSLLSLFFLLAIGLGLFAGPHPCHARQAKPEVAGKSCPMHPRMAGPSTGPRLSAPGSHDCCKTRHGSLCENACQMTAISQAERLVFRIAPMARAVVERSDFGLPVFAHLIDHVPLT